MNDKLSKNPAVSIRAKLLAHAKRHGEDFQRVLTRYAVERLLFRLGQTEEAKCYVLKGAMLFVTWPEHVFRSTGDLDLLGQGDPHPEALTERFTRICQVSFPSDGIVFDGATLKVGTVREIDRYQGACISLVADLAGQGFHCRSISVSVTAFIRSPSAGYFQACCPICHRPTS